MACALNIQQGASQRLQRRLQKSPFNEFIKKSIKFNDYLFLPSPRKSQTSMFNQTFPNNFLLAPSGHGFNDELLNFCKLPETTSIMLDMRLCTDFRIGNA